MECPHCYTEIPNKNINIQTDVAQCSSCQEVFKVSDILNNSPDDNFDMYAPPEGTWIRTGMDSMLLGASTRSASALFLVPFMLVWSGFSLGGIYGTQWASGHFDLTMSLFGIPFLLGSIVLGAATAMTLGGKVELTLDRLGGRIFTGIGTYGFNKKFLWEDVSSVSETLSNVSVNNRQKSTLQFEGRRRLKFGVWLNDSRRYYILQVLKTILSKVNSNKNFL